MTTSSELTARRLNRATLARQLLLDREPLDVVEAVRRVVALQAQTPASPYLALWNRITDFDPTALDAAFAEHALVRAQLVRLTLHAVTREDYPTFQHAVVSMLRASRLHDRRFKDTGMSIDAADALVPEVLAFVAEPRTNAEVEAWLEERLGGPAPRVWWALRQYAAVVRAPVGAAWSFGEQPVYVAGRTAPATGDDAPSKQRLIRRSLEGFGPASAKDLSTFTFLRMAPLRKELDAIVDSLEIRKGPGGVVLYDVPDGLLPDEDTPAPPRLLPMWDSVLLAYADRSRIIPPDLVKVVIRRNGDVLPSVLVDGHVAGVWRPVDGGIEVTAFAKLPRRTWAGLAAEAHALIAFLADRDPNVYSRYGHWWESLPDGDVRVLA